MEQVSQINKYYLYEKMLSEAIIQNDHKVIMSLLNTEHFLHKFIINNMNYDSVYANQIITLLNKYKKINIKKEMIFNACKDFLFTKKYFDLFSQERDQSENILYTFLFYNDKITSDILDELMETKNLKYLYVIIPILSTKYI